MYGPGYLGPVPADLHTEITLNQPHQLDPEIGALDDFLADAVLARVPEDKMVEVGERLGNLSDALYGVRYHQRQFLFRLREVTARYAEVQGFASPQMSVVFHDHPLKFEAEALVTRYRTALDATAHVLAPALGLKPQNFGALATWAGRQRSPADSVIAAVQETLAQYKEWIERVSNYRHGIAHQSRFAEYRGVGYGVHGVAAARVEEYDAADFAIEVWAKLLAFLRDLFVPLSTQGSNPEVDSTEPS